MLDLPSHNVEHVLVVEDSFKDADALLAKSATAMWGSLKSAKRDVKTDPLYIQAQELLKVFDDGFQWKDLAEIIKSAFVFVNQTQKLSIEEQKQQVNKMLDYIIDLTDTPYLPDFYTDAMFKSMTPHFTDLVCQAMNNNLNIIPVLSSDPPTPETFHAFIEKMKMTFSDGLQWMDIPVCIKSIVEFMGGFPYLSTGAKRDAVIMILNGVIDETDTPFLPDSLIDPVFKSLVPPFVDLIFKALNPIIHL